MGISDGLWITEVELTTLIGCELIHTSWNLSSTCYLDMNSSGLYGKPSIGCTLK